jgi:antitoxin component YwqK of YwqJK toxin-antitoxin module
MVKRFFSSKPILKRYYFGNGEIKIEQINNYFYDNSVRREWYENGTIKSIQLFGSDSLRDQKVTFYKNGNVESLSEYFNEMSDGISIKYFETGQIKEKGMYGVGRKYGEWSYFHKNSNLILTGNYHQNNPVGTWYINDTTGTLIAQLQYELTKTYGIEYNNNGKKISQGELENKSSNIAINLLEYDNSIMALTKQLNNANIFETLGFYKYGKWKYWNDSGFLSSILKYSDGQLNGSSVYFDNDGIARDTISYYKGVDESKIRNVSPYSLYTFPSLYEGDIVEITGPVQEYKETIYGKPFITVGRWERIIMPYVGSRGNGRTIGPTCYFGESDKNILKKLRRNSNVTIRGECSVGLLGLVTLKGCVLIDY